jgi:hypothetical protein
MVTGSNGGTVREMLLPSLPNNPFCLARKKVSFSSGCCAIPFCTDPIKKIEQKKKNRIMEKRLYNSRYSRLKGCKAPQL